MTDEQASNCRENSTTCIDCRTVFANRFALLGHHYDKSCPGEPPKSPKPAIPPTSPPPAPRKKRKYTRRAPLRVPKSPSWICRECGMDLGQSYDDYHAHVKSCSNPDASSFPSEDHEEALGCRHVYSWHEVPQKIWFRIVEQRRMDRNICLLTLEDRDAQTYEVEILSYLHENLERYASTTPFGQKLGKRLFIKSTGVCTSIVNRWLSYDNYSLLYY